MNVTALKPPSRTLANVLLDLKEARRDWIEATAPCPDGCDNGEFVDFEAAPGTLDGTRTIITRCRHCDEAEDRATEADRRIDDLRDEFAERFLAATGLTWKQVEEAISEAVL